MPYETVSDLQVGMDVTARFKPDGNSGLGGVVTELHDRFVVLLSGTAQHRNEVMRDEVAYWQTEVPFEAEECTNYNPEHCSGPVEMWYPGSGHRSWPRCTFHGEKRLKDASELERYADSDVAPPWYHDSDEYYVTGQEWDDDY